MPEQPNTALDDARQAAGLSHDELWVRYFELGGMAMPVEVEAYLCGLVIPSVHDHEVLVHALNERFSELGRNRPIAYLDDVSQQAPPDDRPGRRW